MAGEPIHVSDEAFDKTVLQSPIPVIVDFWAPWCGPCKMVLPLLDQLAKDYEGKLIVAEVNTEEQTGKAMEYRVQSIPTLLFVKNGEIMQRHTGSLSAAKLREMADELIA